MIVETLRYFRTILLGQTLRIYIDNKKHTCKSFNIHRVLIWRILLEGYGRKYIVA